MKSLLKKGGKVSELLRSRESSLLLVMVLLVAVIQWRSGGKFLSGTVINQLTQNYAYTAVLAFGMLLVLLIHLLVKYREPPKNGQQVKKEQEGTEPAP